MSDNYRKLYYYWESYPSVRKQLWKTHPQIAKMLHNRYRKKQRKYGRYYESWMGKNIQNWGGGRPAVTSNRNFTDRAKIAVRQWAHGVYNNEPANIVKRAKISNSYINPPPPSITDRIRHGAHVAKDVAAGVAIGANLWDAFANLF